MRTGSNAQAVLTLLGADVVQVSDISPNETPDFIIDLNNPVGPEFNQKFDVIFDIGTLEHIFDVRDRVKEYREDAETRRP